jgi:hypothetical protein
MRSLLSFSVSFALLLAVALRADAADAKKEVPPAKPAGEKAAKDTYVPAGTLQGVVRSADGVRLTLAVTFRTVQATGQNVRAATETKDVPLELADIVKVRATHPIQQFDDKGNIKRHYTPKELKELKGDEGLPGYTAELTDLQPGQKVMVKLARVRPAKPADAPPAAEGKAKSTDPAKAPAPKIVVTLIMIAVDPAK